VTVLEIRDMTAADIEPAVAMYKAGGWGERSEFLQWVLANPATQPLVGVRDGFVVATGMATINGRVGWIGSIFVDRTMRSQGYGRVVTEAVCSRLDAAGCTTQALIASEYGKPLYDNMGFRVDAEYQVLQAETVAKAPVPPVGKSLRPMEPDDLDRICGLDRRATGEDRRGLLAALDGRAWILEADGELLGFLGSILPDSGALIAPKPEDAACLLEQLRYVSHGKVKSVTATVPASHSTGIEGLERLGWGASFLTPRMLRGADIPWNPSLIWGILSRACG
jgi:GNAT superfamily N-acetyltransferase